MPCMSYEDSLSSADRSFNNVLLVHGLEAAVRAQQLLREIWRLLRVYPRSNYGLT